MLNLVLYLTSWELIRNKGYQHFDSALGVVTTKVKGQGFVPIKTKMSKFNKTHSLDYLKGLFTLKPDVNYKILDTAGSFIFLKKNFKNFLMPFFFSNFYTHKDYIIPPSEYNSIFIMTNFIETEQSKGVCDEVRRKEYTDLALFTVIDLRLFIFKELSKYKAPCNKDEDCQNLGGLANTWNGSTWPFFTFYSF